MATKKTKTVPKKTKSRPDNEEDDHFFMSRDISKKRKKFKGISLAKHYKGQTLKNKHGECYQISTKVKIDTIEPNHEKITERLLLDLKVIPGISNTTENILKKTGYNSVIDLKKHSRYGIHATNYAESVESKNGFKIYEHLSARFTSTNPLFLANTAFFNLSEIAFVDIETLGLSECPLFLIGIATFKDEHLVVDQIFVRQLKEEKAALHFLGEHLKGKQAIGTFNGKSFDVPFIRKRMARWNLKHEITLPHFDLKFLSQKAFQDLECEFSLSSLEEELFNVVRKDDVSGYEIPMYYNMYLRSKNIGSIVPIINHNKQDLISTANIFMKLHERLSN